MLLAPAGGAVVGRGVVGCPAAQEKAASASRGRHIGKDHSRILDEEMVMSWSWSCVLTTVLQEHQCFAATLSSSRTKSVTLTGLRRYSPTRSRNASSQTQASS